MADEQDINTPQDQGDDQNQDNQNTDFSTRLQKQSAILGKVVNQSNGFASDLKEVKELVTSLAAAKNTETDDTEEKPKKKKIPAEETEQSLSFKAMQERLEKLEAKDLIKVESAKKNQLGRSLERYGVDAAVSDKVAKLIYIDLGENISVEEEGDKVAVKVKYGEEVLEVDAFAQMWLESDEGRPFKTNNKKSPTPKTQGTGTGTTGDSEGLSMLEFSQKVAEQFASTTSREEARKKAEGFKLKED